MLYTSNCILSAPSDDGKILLDIRHGQIFAVNVLGGRILDLIQLGSSESAIAEEIAQACAVGVEVVRGDVHAFIDALCKHRIVQASPSINSSTPS